MKHAGPTRREIGVRTAFNLIGPLTNPAGATRGLFGVGDPVAAPKMAEVLRALGTERALVIHGDAVDELPLDGSGVLYDVTPAGVERRTIDASTFGLKRAKTSALAGGDAAENARLARRAARGARRAARRRPPQRRGRARRRGHRATIEAGIERAAR